ncbi:response regulator receiver modulated diguanylate phosphodiesterase [Calothrix sp. PCC 7716]|nr:response regulator receiver modulated diguanylate phosphodiesterase [Calothrix sp. PCC 7716]
MTKVLVIEDELGVRENILELLEAENYEVVEAENGRVGVQKAVSEVPDLILCDLMMPEMDGYSVLTALREEPVTATIPFIFLTAKAGKGNFRQGMDLGADDYITKPFTRAELLSAILSRLSKREILRKYLSAKDDILTFTPEIKIIEANLRRALESNATSEFKLFYKPIVNISEKVVAAESFVIWNNPEIGSVYPSELIPLAESTDLIIPLGACLIQLVCEQIQAWTKLGCNVLPISVNISGQEFHNSNFILTVKEAISNYSLEPSKVQIEVNENVIMQNLNNSIDIMHQLRELGIEIAIDDFGTGNSSLICLKKLPINTLKLDPYFIHQITSDLQKSAITDALINMANNLNFKIIIQGVNTEAELIYIRQKKCHYMQGSLFSNSLSQSELEAMLTKK